MEIVKDEYKKSIMAAVEARTWLLQESQRALDTPLPPAQPSAIRSKQQALSISQMLRSPCLRARNALEEVFGRGPVEGLESLDLMIGSRCSLMRGKHVDVSNPRLQSAIPRMYDYIIETFLKDNNETRESCLEEFQNGAGYTEVVDNHRFYHEGLIAKEILTIEE
ncbi:MAG: hypothetical protein Q9199_001848 [Rusavskia elegans]